jgi:hypothetical protein
MFMADRAAATWAIMLSAVAFLAAALAEPAAATAEQEESKCVV